MRYATIRWFDTTTGEGMVRLSDTEESVPLHFSALYKPTDGNYSYPSEKIRANLEKWATEGQELRVNLTQYGIEVAEIIL